MIEIRLNSAWCRRLELFGLGFSNWWRQFIGVKSDIAIASVEIWFGQKRLWTMSECVRSSLGWGWSNLWSLSARDRWSSFTRKNSSFKKTKRPTSVVESYKTTYGHKVVVLMSVVEGRAENICSTWAAFDP